MSDTLWPLVTLALGSLAFMLGRQWLAARREVIKDVLRQEVVEDVVELMAKVERMEKRVAELEGEQTRRALGVVAGRRP